MTITVNQEEWAALGTEQQNLIASIISENFKGETIEPTRSDLADTGELGGICQTGCDIAQACLLYTSPSPRDRTRSRMPSSA